jgi:D-sedoheptulose 7-phosphate isomerase
MSDKKHSYSALLLDDSIEVLEKTKEKYADQMDIAIELLFEAWKMNKWVYIMGNGGSASTATHLAADLTKTITEKPGDNGIKSIALVDNIPAVSAFVNDWGWDDLYSNQLSTFYEDDGIGIAFSVHGGSGTDVAGQWSQNIMKGLQYIKDRGGKTIGFSGFDGGPMKDLVDIPVVVPVNSTPLVEGIHSVLNHIIVFGVKEKIKNYLKFKESGLYGKSSVF